MLLSYLFGNKITFICINSLTLNKKMTKFLVQKKKLDYK